MPEQPTCRCGALIAPAAKFCPRCGWECAHRPRRHWWRAVVIVLVIAGLAAMLLFGRRARTEQASLSELRARNQAEARAREAEANARALAEQLNAVREKFLGEQHELQARLVQQTRLADEARKAEAVAQRSAENANAELGELRQQAASARAQLKEERERLVALARDFDEVAKQNGGVTNLRRRLERAEAAAEELRRLREQLDAAKSKGNPPPEQMVALKAEVEQAIAQRDAMAKELKQANDVLNARQGKSADPRNWDVLSTALAAGQRHTEEQVKQRLGPPTSVQRNSVFTDDITWLYPGGGKIVFRKGQMDEVLRPSDTP